MREYKLAYRDMLRTWEKHRQSLDAYDYTEHSLNSPPKDEPTSTAAPALTLQQAIDEYVYEGKRAGTAQVSTQSKKVTSLGLLTELFGPGKPLATLTKQDAQHAKKVLLELPANRNKMPRTRGLPLLEAVTVPDVAKVSTVTIDGYISAFQTFFDWAEKNGHATSNLFTGMRVGKSNSRATPKRRAFEQDALQSVYSEITENRLGLIRKDSHKWATLIGMFSGARLNEICQLETADIQQADGIWFFNLIDEGDTNKRFKTDAALRKVPIHNELLRIGFLDYHAKTSTHHSRLFPDYSYCVNNGYGRALSRWFNGTLTPALGIKSKHHVFHGFRHTMITRLAQADVEEPIYQSIVGHERQGVTQQVYNRQGYTLPQLKTAIDKFAI
jgi:integrase